MFLQLWADSLEQALQNWHCLKQAQRPPRHVWAMAMHVSNELSAADHSHQVDSRAPAGSHCKVSSMLLACCWPMKHTTPCAVQGLNVTPH